MADVYGNFVYCALSAGISAGTTVLPVDSTARVPDPAMGDVWLTIDSTLAAGQFEIVKVVSKTVNSLTVLRAQEGTLAQASTAAGTYLRGSLTAAMADRLARPRATTTFTSASLAPGAQGTGLIQIAKSYRLMYIQTSRPARVRLYDRAAKRTADLARAIGTDPGIDSGVVLDYVTTAANLTAGLSPLVDGTDWDLNPDFNIPITVDNKDTVTGTVVVTFINLPTEY